MLLIRFAHPLSISENSPFAERRTRHDWRENETYAVICAEVIRLFDILVCLYTNLDRKWANLGGGVPAKPHRERHLLTTGGFVVDRDIRAAESDIGFRRQSVIRHVLNVAQVDILPIIIAGYVPLMLPDDAQNPAAGRSDMESQRHRSCAVLAGAEYIFGGRIQHEGNTNAKDVWWLCHFVGGERIP